MKSIQLLNIRNAKNYLHRHPGIDCGYLENTLK